MNIFIKNLQCSKVNLISHLSALIINQQNMQTNFRAMLWYFFAKLLTKGSKLHSALSPEEHQYTFEVSLPIKGGLISDFFYFDSNLSKGG